MRAAARGLLYLAWLAGFALGTAFLFWRPFVAELRERQPPEGDVIAGIGALDAEVMKLVGSMSSDRSSSFAHHALRAAEGVTRVCAFGDSFTYGDEVRRDQDYPSQLQRLLDAEGASDVEVLNFGSPWHGFHQSFLLWEHVGRRMGCDAALLGPASFQSKRDTSFNHSDLHSPYFLHARFVHDGDPRGDGLRLVPVLGDTWQARFEAYFRFWPHWRYLRYDRNPPALLQALVPKGRRLANPFYYDGASPDEESLAGYRVLLRRMAGSGIPIVLLHQRPELVALGRELGAPNLVAAPAFDARGFPYRARKGHMSVWGNELVARHFQRELSGASAPQGFVLVTAPEAPDPPPAAPRRGPVLPISAYSALEVRLGEHRTGLLVTASTDHWQRGLGAADSLHGSNLRSLLILTDGETSAVDGAVLARLEALREGAPLALRVRREGAWSQRAADPPGRLAPGLPIGVAAVPELHFRDKQELVWRGEPAPERAELLLDGRVVLSGRRRDGELVLEPALGPLRQFAARQSDRVDPALLPASGSFDLLLQLPGGAAGGARGEVRVPLARWRRVPFRPARAEPALPAALRLRGGSPAPGRPG